MACTVTRTILAGLVSLAVLLGTSAEVRAQEGCFGKLRDCFVRAAKMRSWADRTIAGLDCELDFVECSRRKILGR